MDGATGPAYVRAAGVGLRSAVAWAWPGHGCPPTTPSVERHAQLCSHPAVGRDPCRGAPSAAESPGLSVRGMRPAPCGSAARCGRRPPTAHLVLTAWIVDALVASASSFSALGWALTAYQLTSAEWAESARLQPNQRTVCLVNSTRVAHEPARRMIVAHPPGWPEGMRTPAASNGRGDLLEP